VDLLTGPAFNKGIDDLQWALKVIPSDVIYQPVFTYIWSLAENKFQDELTRTLGREEALREIARSYLTGAGMTVRGGLPASQDCLNPNGPR
jgi:hypothetical protein